MAPEFSTNKLQRPNLPHGYFEALPTEIIESIGSYMDKDSLMSFRCTGGRSAECTHYNFQRTYLTTFTTDFSKSDFERLQRRVETDPDSMSWITGLVVRQRCDEAKIKAKIERGRFGDGDPMGSGFEWSWKEGGIDLGQPAVQQWHGLLAKMTNCTSFHFSTKATHLNLQFVQTTLADMLRDPIGNRPWRRNGLTLSDAFELTLEYIHCCNVPLVDMTVDSTCFYPLRDFDPEDWAVRSVQGTQPLSELESLSIIGSTQLDQPCTFVNFVSCAPKLKRLSIQNVEAYFPHRALASSAAVFQLEELNVADTSYMFCGYSGILCVVRGHRRTLKRLSIARITAWRGQEGLLGCLADIGFSVLEEFSLDRIIAAKGMLERYESVLGFQGDGAALFSLAAEQGATLECTRGPEVEGEPYVAFKYLGPGVQQFLRVIASETEFVRKK
ncbi:hypothetical protein BJX64DRAFT_283007 [Aspergillus heterothallicus]